MASQKSKEWNYLRREVCCFDLTNRTQRNAKPTLGQRIAYIKKHNGAASKANRLTMKWGTMPCSSALGAKEKSFCHCVLYPKLEDETNELVPAALDWSSVIFAKETWQATIEMSYSHDVDFCYSRRQVPGSGLIRILEKCNLRRRGRLRCQQAPKKDTDRTAVDYFAEGFTRDLEIQLRSKSEQRLGRSWNNFVEQNKTNVGGIWSDVFIWIPGVRDGGLLKTQLHPSLQCIYIEAKAQCPTIDDFWTSSDDGSATVGREVLIGKMIPDVHNHEWSQQTWSGNFLLGGSQGNASGSKRKVAGRSPNLYDWTRTEETESRQSRLVPPKWDESYYASPLAATKWIFLRHTSPIQASYLKASYLRTSIEGMKYFPTNVMSDSLGRRGKMRSLSTFMTDSTWVGSPKAEEEITSDEIRMIHQKDVKTSNSWRLNANSDRSRSHQYPANGDANPLRPWTTNSGYPTQNSNITDPGSKSPILSNTGGPVGAVIAISPNQRRRYVSAHTEDFRAVCATFEVTKPIVVSWTVNHGQRMSISGGIDVPEARVEAIGNSLRLVSSPTLRYLHIPLTIIAAAPRIDTYLLGRGRTYGGSNRPDGLKGNEFESTVLRDNTLSSGLSHGRAHSSERLPWNMGYKSVLCASGTEGLRRGTIVPLVNRKQETARL
ncbi:hypothetical protein ARMGADRAFT_1032034 [Armillaria gallica]|uniref:Uncharacterized protein n=1 Tax=Armillaria gallica TaxID=47427 RepID=A0A2H3DPE0_ARMGA|nr:hypothetical protein ARMGADRAFT_1032034 [Armillaria gallica]